MKTFTKIKNVVDKILSWMCIAILALMTILVTYQVISRFVFSKANAYTENLSQYLFVWMVMFGTALVFGERGHLEITTIKSKLPPLPYMILEIITNICLVGFAALVLIAGGYLIAKSQMNTSEAILPVKMGMIYAGIPISGVLVLFYGVYNVFRAVDEYKNHVARSEEVSAGTL